MKWLLLGAKEYPFGAGARDDPLPSGGYEKYAEQLAHALVQAGHDVHIVTRRFKKPAKSLPHDPRIHVHRVPWLSGPLLRNPSFNAAALAKAARLDFDVILTQGVMATLAAVALRKIKNRPLIALPAGIAYGQPQHSVWLNAVIRRLETAAYSGADAVVFLSKQEQEQFQAKLGFLPRRHAIIPPGVAIVREKNKKTREEKKQEKTKSKKQKSKGISLQLLFVGRLVQVKGLAYLLDAMKGLDAELTVVGKGPDEEKLRHQAERLGLPNVRFAGYHADPTPHYKKADVFVLPSLSEGLPMAALEAAGHGLPLIVTDIGLPFENGKTALVVPPKDGDALRGAIRTLQNPALRRRLGRNAQAFVRRQYDWKKTVTALEVLVARL